MNEEQIKIFGERLHISMNKERVDTLKSTYEDWMSRAKKLDEKISPLGLHTPVAANIFGH